MKDLLTSGDVAKLFGDQFTSQTVREWTKEFSDYLSDYTRPAAGQTKMYNADDVRVIAYIHERRSRFNSTFDVIHDELAAGNRGDIPESPTIRAETELEAVMQERDQLKMEVEMLRVRMATSEGMAQEYKLQLEKQTEDAKKTYADLNQEIGKLKAMIEIMKEQMKKD